VRNGKKLCAIKEEVYPKQREHVGQVRAVKFSTDKVGDYQGNIVLFKFEDPRRLVRRMVLPTTN
jgi:hypothetical protein